MDMAACQGCGQSVPVGTGRCPHCGRKKPHTASPVAKIFLAGVAALVLIVLVAL